MALLCGLALTQPALAQEQAAEASGSGEDILKPSRRVDLRTELSGTDEERELLLTLRHDRSVPVGNEWQVRLRIDLPFKTLRTEEEGHGDWGDIGLGDVLLHTAFVRQTGKDEGFGIGAQLIIPTASREELGKGKWRLRPTVGYRWGLSQISDGSFFQLLARYDFSFAGDDDRSKVSDLQVSPNLEVALPGEAYVSFFPSADIRYNFVHDEFFLPFDIELGKDWKNLVFSIEAAKALIKDDHAPYDWRVETRVGLRF